MSIRTSAQQEEKALIARLLMEPKDIAKIDGLEPEDFELQYLRKAFRAIVKRYLDGRPFDAVTVEADSGVAVDIMELSPASFGPVEEYVNAILDASYRRRAVWALENEDEPGEVIRKRKDSGLRGTGEVTRSYADEFLRRGTTTDSGIPYGIASLDRTLLPMRSGRLVVIASRPGIGKTALAESISDYAARRTPVLFVSLEMGAEELTDRAMARASGIKAGKIMRGEIKIEELEEHLKARADLPITYLDAGATTTAHVLAAAQRLKNDSGLGLIIVDYLQLLADKGENEVYRVGNIAHGLKRMALKLKVPVLALAQLNRSIDYGGRAPRLSDIRDSGIVEQDAGV